MRKMFKAVIVIAAVAAAVSPAFGGMMTMGAGKPAAVATANPFALDGTPVSLSSNAPGTTFAMPGISTTYGNDINIVVVTTNGSPVVSMDDVPHNIYSRLTSSSNMEIWYAKAAAVQTGNVVSITLTSNNFTSASVSSFSGAKFSAPFDPNIPSGVTSTSAVSIATTNANDILIGASIPTSGLGAAASPWSVVFSAAGTGGAGAEYLAVEYQKVTATQSGASLNFTDNTTYGQVAIALVQGP